MASNRWMRMGEPLILAVASGYLLSWLQFQVAWLIGPLLAGICYVLLLGTSAPLPARWMTVAKAIVGLVAASRFVPEDLTRVWVYLVPVLVAISVTGGLCLLNGYLISRLSKVDRTTCLLGSIPGTATAIVAISAEFGADPVSVAILQYLRMTIVILLVPVAASFFSLSVAPSLALVRPDVVSHDPVLPIGIDLLLLAAAAAVGVFFGEKFRLPTGAFLGSFLVGLTLFWFLAGQLVVPRYLSLMALLVIGLSAGLKFNIGTMRKLWKAVLLEVVLVILLVMSCLWVGYWFHWLTHVDITTSMLALAPGGMEAMIATSNQLGSDTGLVLIIMFLRQLLIITGMAGLRYYFLNKKLAA